MQCQPESQSYQIQGGLELGVVELSGEEKEMKEMKELCHQSARDSPSVEVEKNQQAKTEERRTKRGTQVKASSVEGEAPSVE
jgi:hypothetical protein